MTRKIISINCSTGETKQYSSNLEAAKELGLSPSSICQNLAGNTRKSRANNGEYYTFMPWHEDITDEEIQEKKATSNIEYAHVKRAARRKENKMFLRRFVDDEEAINILKKYIEKKQEMNDLEMEIRDADFFYRSI